MCCHLFGLFVYQAQMLHYLPGTVYSKIGPLKYLKIISKQQTFSNNLFNFKFGVQYFNLI